MSNAEMTPNRKRAVVFYLLIIFAVAFLLVLISMFVRMRTIQDDYDTEQSEVQSSYAEHESEIIESVSKQDAEYQGRIEEMERNIHASELLILAQDAYYKGNSRAFQGYMASLEGYADALSADALKIYEELVNELRG